MIGACGFCEHEGPEHGMSSCAGPSESMVSRSDVSAENRVMAVGPRCAALRPPHAASALEGAQAIDPRSRTIAPSIERLDRLADETLIFRSFLNPLATAQERRSYKLKQYRIKWQVFFLKGAPPMMRALRRAV
jgi:hypothetical protein